jgi:hypothetical protein
MAALVQSYPQQSSTVTMLQTRPSSASSILQGSSQSQSHHPYPANPSQMQKNSFHGMNNVMGVSNYRGHTAVAPIAPYAFTSTPGLTMPGQRAQGPHLRSDQRTSSAPNVQTFHHSELGNNVNRSRYPAAPSVSTSSTSSSSDLSALSHKSGTRDDSAIVGKSRVTSGAPRPHSTIITSGQSLAPPALSSPVKPSPDRYRRPNNRRAESSSSQQSAAQISQASALPNVMQFYSNSAQQPFNVPMAPSNKNTSGYTSALGVTADDMQLHRHSTPDQAKRYRRRSIHTIDAGDYTHHGSNPISGGFQQQGSRQVSSANGRIDHQQHPLRSSPVVTIQPASSHGRNGSSESVNSTRSSHHSRPNSVSMPLNSYTAFSHIINLSLPN